METIKEIPFKIDVDSSLRRLSVEPESGEAREFAALANRVTELAKPKALYRRAFVEERRGESVRVDGVLLESGVLRSNLENIESVFPYVATCGSEVDGIDIPANDYLKKFWLDEIKRSLLDQSIDHLTKLLTEKYRLGGISSMSPGSGDATTWPIEQQKNLFALLGDVEELIGVKLTKSYLMIPNKTVSGIFFPSSINFESCRICHRENCSGRRAPFDKQMWRSIHSR